MALLAWSPLLVTTFASCNPSLENVPVGGECNEAAECAPVQGKQLSCSCTPAGGSRPQCVTLLVAGDDCTRPKLGYYIPCADGLKCTSIPSGTRRCAAVIGAGGDCTKAPCGKGYFCEQGKCAPGRKVGELCVASEGDVCAAGSACGPSGICITTKASGYACEADVECESEVCLIPDGGKEGVCSPPPSPGALRSCSR